MPTAQVPGCEANPISGSLDERPRGRPVCEMRGRRSHLMALGRTWGLVSTGTGWLDHEAGSSNVLPREYSTADWIQIQLGERSI